VSPTRIQPVCQPARASQPASQPGMAPPARASRCSKRLREAAATALIASPRGLSLMLEVRALLGAMDEPCAQINVWLGSIGARLDALGDVLPSAGSVANVASPWQTLDDLSPELLALVARALEPDSEMAASLSCRKLRAAVAAEWQRGGRNRSTTLVRTAITSLRKLLWAASCGLPMDAALCARLAAEGRLVELSWVRAQGCPWEEDTCSDAAFGGHLAVLQWARTNGAPWNEWTCSEAAYGGQFSVLIWARANGAAWDDNTCLAAAAGGHLSVLMWARLNGCTWDECTVKNAASAGHLSVLQWARAHECPYGVLTVRGAREAMLEEGIALQYPDWDVTAKELPEEFEAVLEWLRADGCPELSPAQAKLEWIHALELQLLEEFE